MELSRLVLSDIGCFPQKTVDFSPLTVVFGENRTGKSTLVAGLYFTLYGRHLSTGLTIKDLCRKGAESGTATLYFKAGETPYRLRQWTDRLPKLFQVANEAANENEEASVPIEDPAQGVPVLPVPHDIAALGSFFREGELIYFLQDIPRYNQTLLQQMIGLDDVMLVRARFKKALGKAKTFRRGILNAAPKGGLDALNLELNRRQLAESEQALQAVETALQQLLQTAGADPAVKKLLTHQHQNKRNSLDALMNLKKEMSSEQRLTEQRTELENAIKEAEPRLAKRDALQRQLGALDRHLTDLSARLRKVETMSGDCPLCGQMVTPETLSDLTERLRQEMADARNERSQCRDALKSLSELAAKIDADTRKLAKIRDLLEEGKRLDNQIAETSAQVTELESDLKQFDTLNRDHQTAGPSRQELEKERTRLQEKILRCRVALKQHEDFLKRRDEYEKNNHQAERDVLVCDTAFQALDGAIQDLGRSLLERIRESVRNWHRQFTFLDRFDIQMTDTELLPVIQASGYQYKLNQMSKSERIFLYLMLKLAIGDALGHLGVFVLDDPADGLDAKRKQTLAYLLAEVARRRQVIVTTNDQAFAESFPEAQRVVLTA